MKNFGIRFATLLHGLIHKRASFGTGQDPEVVGVFKIGPVYFRSYIARPRIPSGEALALCWSLWIRILFWWIGWGEVKPFGYPRDVEVTIGGSGPWQSGQNGVIVLSPAPVLTPEQFRFIQIRNVALNPRELSGSVCLQCEYFGLTDYLRYPFVDLPNQAITLAGCRDGNLRETLLNNPPSAIVVKIVVNIEPAGTPRVIRLHGGPEWR